LIENQVVLAGVDDAAKCPCIGSISLAGVVADSETILEWKKLGVKDSKLLSRPRRDALSRLIKKTALTTSVRHIPPHIIDDKTFNLNMWEMLTVLQILGGMRRRCSFSDVYIDNWEVNKSLFFSRFKSAFDPATRVILESKKIFLRPGALNSLRFIPEHKADENHTIVGAASILARSASDRQYDQLRKQYGDFGSGSPGDPATRLFVWKNRHSPPPIVRKSWETFLVLSGLNDIADDPSRARNTARLSQKKK
jgi:ribonuclease HII